MSAEPEPEPAPEHVREQRPPPRKPFEVPTSGDFWLHDDRMGEGDGQDEEAAAEQKKA